MIEEIIILLNFGPLRYWRDRHIIAARPEWVRRVIRKTSGFQRYLALRAWLDMERGRGLSCDCYYRVKELNGAFMWDFHAYGHDFWTKIYYRIYYDK